VAFTIGYLLSFFMNFWLSAKFTFKAEATVKRGAGFALSHLVNYGLQMLVLNVSLKFGVPEPLAPVPVYLICIPVNFLLVRFVFKKI
jgi:putative flippase GtrA